MYIRQIIVILLSLGSFALAQGQNLQTQQVAGEGVTISAEDQITAENEAALREEKISLYEGQTKRFCEDRWTVARDELLTCLEQQTSAQLGLQDTPPEYASLKNECSIKWIYDFVLQRYCLDTKVDLQNLREELGITSLPPGRPRIYRFVSDLTGPYRVTKVLDQQSVEVYGETGTEVVTLGGIAVAELRAAKDYLQRRLLDHAIYLEKAQKGESILYVYALNGEWKSQDLPLKQINLVLVEQGLATPDQPPSKYAHFYQTAVEQAAAAYLGIWATR